MKRENREKRNELLFNTWRKGWDSAASQCNQALKTLLSRAQYVPERALYEINEEAFAELRDTICEGLWENMRIGTRAGLDYYFAAVNPSTLAEADNREATQPSKPLPNHSQTYTP